jgi:predicted transposase/invertase (TIGR01784 family)
LNKESLPSPLNNPELKKALGVLEMMNFGEEERDAYEERLKWLRVEANTLKKYEEKGRAEGEQIGLEKGEQIGLEKVALNMLQKGLSPLDIHELTGLDERVIDRLYKTIISPVK